MCTTSGLLVVIIILIIFLLCAKLRAAKTPCRKYCAKVQKVCNSACRDEGMSIGSPMHTEGYVADQDLVGEDHSEAIKKMGLEDDVISSHERFVRELDHKTTTASNACDFCQKVCKGKRRSQMFSRLEYVYCGTDCVKKHQRELTAAAAMARLGG